MIWINIQCLIHFFLFHFPARRKLLQTNNIRITIPQIIEYRIALLPVIISHRSNILRIVSQQFDDFSTVRFLFST